MLLPVTWGFVTVLLLNTATKSTRLVQNCCRADRFHSVCLGVFDLHPVWCRLGTFYVPARSSLKMCLWALWHHLFCGLENFWWCLAAGEKGHFPWWLETLVCFSSCNSWQNIQQYQHSRNESRIPQLVKKPWCLWEKQSSLCEQGASSLWRDVEELGWGWRIHSDLPGSGHLEASTLGSNTAFPFAKVFALCARS